MSHLHSILNPESSRRLQQQLSVTTLQEEQSSSSVDQRSSSADDEISSTSADDDEVDELDDENEGEIEGNDDDDELQVLPSEEGPDISEGDETSLMMDNGENPEGHLDPHDQSNSAAAPRRRHEKHDRKIDLGLHDHKAHVDCPDTLACLPDTNGRPQHTLPVILRCAILGSLRKRLTIREIYAAMESKYPFYKSAGQTWKQSVRHHLSLNRLFERQPRPVTDPGFGSYWTVNLEAPPGTKRPRRRGRPNREIGDGSSKKTAAAKAQPQLHIQTHINVPQQPTLFQFQPQTHPTPPLQPSQQQQPSMNGLPSPHSPQHQSAPPQPSRQQTLQQQQESDPMHQQEHPSTPHQQPQHVQPTRPPLMHQLYSSHQPQPSHHVQCSHLCQSPLHRIQSSHQSQSSHPIPSQIQYQHHNSRQPEPLHRYHPPPLPSTPSTPLSSRESFLPSSSSDTGDGGKMTHEEDNNGPTVSDDERESEEEVVVLPQTHSRQLSGQSVTETRSNGSFQLPPFSILDQTRVKQMQEEIATLRRTSAEAVSTSIRLSEQLANANLEVSRSREAVRDLEDMLQSEITKRNEAERLKDIEMERRRAAEQALNGITSRSPTRPRPGTS